MAVFAPINRQTLDFASLRLPRLPRADSSPAQVSLRSAPCGSSPVGRVKEKDSLIAGADNQHHVIRQTYSGAHHSLAAVAACTNFDSARNFSESFQVG